MKPRLPSSEMSWRSHLRFCSGHAMGPGSPPVFRRNSHHYLVENHSCFFPAQARRFMRSKAEPMARPFGKGFATCGMAFFKRIPYSARISSRIDAMLQLKRNMFITSRNALQLVIRISDISGYFLKGISRVCGQRLDMSRHRPSQNDVAYHM